MAAETIVIEFTADTDGLTKALDILERMGTVSKKDADEFRNLSKASNEFKSSQDGVQTELTQTEKLLSSIALQGQKTNALLELGTQKQGTAFKKANSDVGLFSSSIGKIGGLIAGAFAVERVIAFGAESVKAFQEAEKAAIKLRSAVAVNGGLQQDFEDLVAQSKELQGISIFSDEAIINAQTAALQFGLTKDQVEKLIPVVADFASATGQDLQQALDGVLQGINGMGRGLKIYGVSIDETQSKSERLGDITQQLTKKFEDQAEAIGNTAFGAAEKYKNQLDDFQETIGERLSPLLQGLREQFLVLADGATKGAEKIRDAFKLIGDAVSFTTDPFAFFKAKAEQNAEEVAKITEKIKSENAKQIAQFKKDFEQLGENQIAAKLQVLSSLLEENRKQAKDLSAEEASSLNLLAVEYANQIAALQLIKTERANGKKSIDEQTEAINKLKNISALSVEELNAIKKVLSSFNDVNLDDEIKSIEKELDARKKAGEKEIQQRQQALENLHKLEQDASEENLKIKAEEVDKIAQLEQEKQIKLKNLVESFAKVQGASIEDLLKNFDDTGIIDLEEAFKRIEKTNPPTAEFQKFKEAIDDTTDSTNRLANALIEQNKISSFANQLKEQFKFIDEQVLKTAQDIETKFADKKIKITTSLQQQGETANLGDIKQANDSIVKLEREREEELLRNSVNGTKAKIEAQQHYQQQVSRVNESIKLDDKEVNEEIVANNKKANELRIQSDEDSAKTQEEIARESARLQDEIYQTLINGITDLLRNFADQRFEGEIKSLESQLEATNEFLDKEIEANEEAHNKKRKGDKAYENTKKELLKQREDAEKKTAKEIAEIKRKQAKVDKEIAIFEIILNTAKAVSSVAPVVPLMILTAALGAVQLAIAIAQPIPQFAKGTSYVRDDSKADGIDTVPAMLTKGERVVPVKQNKEYWSIYEAIDKGILDNHINREYVQPKLIKEREKIVREIEKLPVSTVNNFRLIDTLRTEIRSLTNNFVREELKKESGFSSKQISSHEREVLDRIQRVSSTLKLIEKYDSTKESTSRFENKIQFNAIEYLVKEAHSALIRQESRTTNNFSKSDSIRQFQERKESINRFNNYEKLTVEEMKREVVNAELVRIERDREKLASNFAKTEISKYQLLKSENSKETSQISQKLEREFSFLKSKSSKEKESFISNQIEKLKQDKETERTIRYNIIRREIEKTQSEKIQLRSELRQFETNNTVAKSERAKLFERLREYEKQTVLSSSDRIRFEKLSLLQSELKINSERTATVLKALKIETPQIPSIAFRSDLLQPVIIEKAQAQPTIKLDEYGVGRALKDGANLTDQTIKKMGKAVADAIPKEYSPYHRI